MIEMFPASENASFSSGFIIAVPTLLFVLYFVLYSNGTQILKRESYLISYTTLTLGIYLSSLVCGGITSAFPTRTQYLSVILPVIVLWGTCKHSEQYYDFIMKCVCSVFIGLALYFFSNYSLHVFEEIESQNNGAYTLLYFLPFVLCIRKGYLRIGGMVIVLAALLFSLKRGGLLAFALAVLVYWLVYTFSYSGKRFSFWHFVVSVLVVGGLVYFYVYFDQMTGYLLSARFQSILDDGGSGRLAIYPVVWEQIKESSFINIIFGHGWDAVRMQCGMDRSAHNDFLEILYDFGIIVFILYILFYIKLFKVVRRLIKRRSFYAAPFSATFMLLAANSMVSHILYYPKYAVLFALFFGLLSVPIYKEIR
jgi:O-antigen ligase